jgi:hypothetical protein
MDPQKAGENRENPPKIIVGVFQEVYFRNFYRT